MAWTIVSVILILLIFVGFYEAMTECRSMIIDDAFTEFKNKSTAYENGEISTFEFMEAVNMYNKVMRKYSKYY